MRHWILVSLAAAGCAALVFSFGCALAQEGGSAQGTTAASEAGPAKSDEAKKELPPRTRTVPPAPMYTKDNAPATPKVDDLPLRDSVSQYDITWTFDKPARVGQFITGDWYVVGPVTVAKIDPKPLWGDEVKETINRASVREAKYPGKQARNGSSLNPVPRTDPKAYCKVGFDSRTPGDRYDPDLFAHLPIKMNPGDSLVSTISRDNSEIKSFSGQHVDPLRSAAVLTCLAEPQPPDAFRPSYCDTKNSRIYLSRNLHRELLTNLPRVDGMPETLDTFARKFQRPWIELADFGFAAPTQNMPHYGQRMAEQVGEGSLLLLMDYPAEEKETPLVHLVQIGIDFYGAARVGFTWHAHGGLYSGRKWPIILAGMLLDDADLKTPTSKVPGVVFHEDDQTAFGPVTYRGKTFEKSWSGSRAIFLGHSPYQWSRGERHWQDGWGLLDVYPPSEWPDKNKDKGSILASEGYRRSNTSGCWIPEALAARIMHAEKTWNHDAFFAYVDRWMTEDDLPHIKAIKEQGWFKNVSLDLSFGEWPRHGYYSNEKWVKWVKPAWQKYRYNLPPAKDGSRTPPPEETWK